MVTTADERRFFHIVIRLVFVAAAFSTLIALFGSWFWLAELFTHFRLYYLLLLALLALIFLHGGYYRLMLLSFVLLLPNAWVVGPYLTTLPGSHAAVADDALNVVAFNINYETQEFADILAYLSSHSPDVIIVSESTPYTEWMLRDVIEGYPYKAGEARTDPWGLRVYSRLPFREVERLSLGERDDVQLRLQLEVSDRVFEIYAVHLYPPLSFELAASRNGQLARLAKRVKESDRPLMVIGDLNITPFSPYFQQFIDTAGLVDARRNDGYHITWPASVMPLWIPIDHALAGNELDVMQVKTGPAVGSDHYPLEAQITLP